MIQFVSPAIRNAVDACVKHLPVLAVIAIPGAVVGLADRLTFDILVLWLVVSLSGFVVSTFVSTGLSVAFFDIVSERRPNMVRTYAAVADRSSAVWYILGRLFLHVLLPAITVIGIPYAVYKLVQWWFAPYAVGFHGASGKDSLQISAQAVSGRWWSLVLVLVLFFVVLGAPQLALAFVSDSLPLFVLRSVIAVTLAPFAAGFFCFLMVEARAPAPYVSAQSA